MKTIVVANHKGGCSKTTATLNLAVTFALTGANVLAIDLDPQGNLSASLGVDLQQIEESRLTSHRLMLDESGDFSSYKKNVRPRLVMTYRKNLVKLREEKSQLKMNSVESTFVSQRSAIAGMGSSVCG